MLNNIKIINKNIKNCHCILKKTLKIEAIQKIKSTLFSEFEIHMRRITVWGKHDKVFKSNIPEFKSLPLHILVL